MKSKKIELKGKRIVLKELNIKHASDIAKILNDVDVSKYMYRVSYPYKIAHAKEFITSVKENSEMKGFSIFLNGSKGVIGYVGMHGPYKYDDYKSVGVEYWIGKEHWGKGYANEAVSIIINHGFKKMKLDKINARVYSANSNSIGLLERLGFKETSRRRNVEQNKYDGSWMDEVNYELPKKRWKK